MFSNKIDFICFSSFTHLDDETIILVNQYFIMYDIALGYENE